MTKQNKTKMIARSGQQEIIVIREFDAPRDLVFKAWTTASLYSQWIGPRGYSTTIETLEPHLGGSYRFVQRDAAGNEYAFYGVYHEVTAPERIICTFEYEGLPERGHVSLDTYRLEELPGDRTRLTNLSAFLSVEDRDGMIKDGMERGIRESYQRLDELLGELMAAGSHGS